MVAVFVNEIVDHIELVPIETINERKARSVAITKAHHAARLQGNDPCRE